MATNELTELRGRVVRLVTKDGGGKQTVRWHFKIHARVLRVPAETAESLRFLTGQLEIE